MIAQHRDPRLTRRFAPALTLSICALAVAAATPASAANVSSSSLPSQTVTTFTDGVGEINTVTVSQDAAGQIIVRVQVLVLGRSSELCGVVMERAAAARGCGEGRSGRWGGGGGASAGAV